MSAFWYSIALQWRLDIRSKSLLITCYVVPLIFFALMGGIFTSINPVMKESLIQSMTVMGVSMGALIGMPTSLVEIYASDIKKAYIANGVPVYIGVVSVFISAFIHLMIMSAIIFVAAPIAFGAALPANIPVYFAALAIFVAATLSVGCALGLGIKNQAKLTMVSQLAFLPSIMLSGIMFPIELLPRAIEGIGKIFPAAWGYMLMLDNGFTIGNLWPMLLVLLVMALLCGFFLKKSMTDIG